MTRLTEALERARALGESGDPAPAEPTTSATSPSVPGTWRFDADQMRSEEETPELESPALDALDDLDEEVHGQDLELADYPFARGTAAQTLVVGRNANNTLVEQYRHLAASLHHAQLRTGARTVMVCSAVESEGKTTTAANIALTLSHSHHRNVLLIDADLRRPSIHSLLQLGSSTGLSETLRNVSSKSQPPLHRISPNLSVMTAGKATQDPMSLLVSDMMRNFIAEAAQEYDWVILDTPPVAILSDANLLASMVDLALLVIRAETTPYPLVRRAVEAIGQQKILGVVLNRAKRSEIAAGYGYYYGYGYNYSTASRHAKRGWWPFSRKR